MRSIDHIPDQGVVKFFATWCGPCKLYAGAFNRVAEKNPDIDFYEIDVDQHPELKDQARVISVPTTIFFKDGAEVHRIRGATSTGRLDATVKFVLS